MITEDYVSFEIAKLLKEKGFDWDCKQVYDLVRPQSCADGKMYDNFPDKNPNAHSELVSAPTLQMAMKWLREVYGLFVRITEDMTGNVFEWSVYQKNYGCRAATFVEDSYEQACEAAIKYTLKKLI